MVTEPDSGRGVRTCYSSHHVHRCFRSGYFGYLNAYIS